ncbi:MAG: RimK family alpha-L-glutamate ligase [Chloroflexi bacterium]|nr:RimK family alpha-L-glutamate ligase [Chloroflexota bacterium]
MKGWILYRRNEEHGLKPEDYEVDRLMETGNKLNIEMRVVHPNDFDLVVTKGGRKSLLIDGEYPTLPDFVLPRTGAATSYYALAVMRHLERLGLFVFNSSQSVEVVKDKMYTQQLLALNNIPVPRTMLVKFPVNVEFVEQQLGFPVVIKTLSGTQGVGVFLAESKQGFGDLMELIGTMRSNATILLQEFVKESYGRDLRVFVIGGRAITCMERASINGGFKANISQGGHAKPFAMTPEIEWLATETARIVGLDIAGIDLLFAGSHFKVCEANSAPGFEGLEKYCDVDIATEIYNYIRIRLGKWDQPETEGFLE